MSLLLSPPKRPASVEDRSSYFSDPPRRATPAAPGKAAVLFQVSGHGTGSLVKIQQLSVLVLTEVADDSGRHLQSRLSGYSTTRIPWGVRFGGVEGHRFLKDLRLPPQPGARGSRLNSHDSHRLRLMIRLQDALQKGVFSRSLRLPRLWAGFEPRFAASISGDGPELLGACHTRGESSQELMIRHRRRHAGLVLFPLDWVSHVADKTRVIFADLAEFPCCQTITLPSSPSAHPLQGYRGACEFDFVSNRFESESG